MIIHSFDSNVLFFFNNETKLFLGDLYIYSPLNKHTKSLLSKQVAIISSILVVGLGNGFSCIFREVKRETLF
jgi:hypothetical protein